jgi:hypothetical protein
MADTEWRLLRIPTLEAALLALGRTELGAGYTGDPVTLEILISRTYEKDFRNLGLQERRLRNYLKSDAAELARIQAERLAAAELPEEEPAGQSVAPSVGQPPPIQNGFEFSTPAPTPEKPVQPTQIDEIVDQTEAAAA